MWPASLFRLHDCSTRRQWQALGSACWMGRWRLRVSDLSNSEDASLRSLRPSKLWSLWTLGRLWPWSSRSRRTCVESIKRISVSSAGCLHGRLLCLFIQELSRWYRVCPSCWGSCGVYSWRGWCRCKRWHKWRILLTLCSWLWIYASLQDPVECQSTPQCPRFSPADTFVVGDQWQPPSLGNTKFGQRHHGISGISRMCFSTTY